MNDSNPAAGPDRNLDQNDQNPAQNPDQNLNPNQNMDQDLAQNPDQKPDQDPVKKPDRIFSAAKLCENFMGNSALVKSILIRFIERTERQIGEIPLYAERGEWDTALRGAHTIKGSARNLGGKELGDAAMGWEEACRQQDMAAVKVRGLETAAAFARFRAAAEQFLSREQDGQE
jgi:HPt (histidine-containing phosphotransfer) domain-containing protein